MAKSEPFTVATHAIEYDIQTECSLNEASHDLIGKTFHDCINEWRRLYVFGRSTNLEIKGKGTFPQGPNL